MSTEGIIHRRISTNGIWMHVAELGKGPLVLLIHGFPELWSSWNYQITHLAKHGYRVVAPDMRGYGDSDSPPDPASYTILHLVGDLIGLLDQLGEEKAFVVGHDWGAEVTWHLCLLRPDRVKALVNLGVPFRPRSPELKPLKFMNQVFGDSLYIIQFQEPGRAEKSFSRYDCLTILKKFLLVDAPDLLAAPPGVEIIDFLDTPSELPPWITEEELQFSASKFQQSGFTGGLNYYRAMDMNWELLGAWQGVKITTPTKYIVGDKDLGFEAAGTREYIEGEPFKGLVPNMEVVVIDGLITSKLRKLNELLVKFYPSLMSEGIAQSSRYVKLKKDQAPVEDITPGELNQPIEVPQLIVHRCNECGQPLPESYQPPADEDWTTGICGCAEDRESCWTGLFCPCVLFGHNVEQLREDIPWTNACVCHALCVEGGMTLAAATALFHGIDPKTSFLICEGLLFTWWMCGIYTGLFRQSLQKQYHLKNSPCDPCLVHCCMHWCAICQEHREMKGHLSSNSAMPMTIVNPPPVQEMDAGGNQEAAPSSKNGTEHTTMEIQPL